MENELFLHLWSHKSSSLCSSEMPLTTVKISRGFCDMVLVSIVFCRSANFYNINYCKHVSICCSCLGINEGKFDDGHFLPHTQGFQYVGTILPFTLLWNCDTSKVCRRNILILFPWMFSLKKF